MIKKLTIVILLNFIASLIALQAQSVYLEYDIIDSIQVNHTKIDFELSRHDSYKSLIDERQAKIKELHEMGYLEATNKQLLKKNDSIFTSYIYIGNQTTTAAIKTTVLNWPKELKNSTSLDKHNRLIIPFQQLEQQLSEFQSNWENQGYSFVKVQLKNILKCKDTLFADLLIVKNELRKIDSINIKGYENFPIKILHHRFGLKPNKNLSQKNIKNASQTIEATGIARETRSPEILYEKDKSTVYFYFEKSNNNFFDGIIGFATNEDSGKLEFSGNLDLSLHNNLNKGEKLTIYYQADGGDQQELEINLETPYIANSPISAGGGIQIFKKDSTYTTTSLNAKLKLDKKNWSYYLGYEKNQSVNRLEETTSNSKVANLDGRFYFLGTSYTLYQSDLLQPIRSYADIKLGTGKREAELQSESQFKIELQGLHTITLAKNHSIFSKVMFNKLWSDTYYLNETYKFGGIKNIRGFNENSIDASQAILLQTEYRYELSTTMYVHTITDLGWIENKVLNSKDNLIGVGFGIGIYNKLGLMHVQIANGSTGKNKIDFDKTRIHISLQSRF